MTSHMHGFDEGPPKSLSEVYKVYCDWAIRRPVNRMYGTEAKPSWSRADTVFRMYWDECSPLEYLNRAIEQVIEKSRSFRFGDDCYYARKKELKVY